MSNINYFFVAEGVFESSSPAQNFISRADSLEDISEFNCEFIITKSNLGGYEVGNFWYRYHYLYNFKTKLGKAYLLQIGRVECVEISIRQLMSDYADDLGSTNVKFKVGNVSNEVRINGGRCQTPEFIGAIIDFMKEFEHDFSANWAYYDKVKELEKTNLSLQKQVLALEKKLSKYQS